MPIRRFYDRWPQYNRRLTEIVRAMTGDQLAINPARPPADLGHGRPHMRGRREH